jgi:hypothetical protein
MNIFMVLFYIRNSYQNRCCLVYGVNIIPGSICCSFFFFPLFPPIWIDFNFTFHCSCISSFSFFYTFSSCSYFSVLLIRSHFFPDPFRLSFNFGTVSGSRSGFESGMLLKKDLILHPNFLRAQDHLNFVSKNRQFLFKSVRCIFNAM